VKIIDDSNKESFVNIKSGFLEVKPDNEVRFIVEE
jgi:F0F1-type ATP synthase epsilon subunit